MTTATRDRRTDARPGVGDYANGCDVSPEELGGCYSCPLVTGCKHESPEAMAEYHELRRKQLKVLAEHMRTRGLSRNEVAERMEVSVRTYHRIVAFPRGEQQ